MIRVSGPNIQKVVAAIGGQPISGITYSFTGNTAGIQAVFTTDAADEQQAKDALKKHLKQAFPVLRFYVEVI